MKFGEKLMKLRKEKGISQEELANQLNVSRQAVSKWENDQGYPETEKLLMIGNIFSVTMDYLLKEEPRDTSSESEQGYYASREIVQGFLNREHKDVIKLDIGVMFFILSGLPILFIPEIENIMSVFTIIMIVIGIVILTILGFQEDPYKRLKKERLYFDTEVLQDIKSAYARLRKRYIGCFIAGICLIFLCMIVGILADDILYLEEQIVDPIYLILIASSVFLFIYGYGMMETYELLVNNEVYYQKKHSYDFVYYVLIGIASILYIALGMLYGGMAWKTGWAIVAVAAILAYGIVYVLERRKK